MSPARTQLDGRGGRKDICFWYQVGALVTL